MFDLQASIADIHTVDRTQALREVSPAHNESAEASVMVSSYALLRGGRELVIRHGDTCYRLRHTRNDKLILTK